MRERKIQSAFDPKKVGRQVFKQDGKIRVVTVTGEGMTEQTHKKTCDMNYILRDYQKTGLIRHAKQHEGKYDDVTGADFQTAMYIVTNAQAMFDDLPSSWRKRFHNDPAEFMEYVHNPENKAEMQKMGMLKGNDGLDAAGKPSGAPVKEPAAPPPPEA